MADTAEGLLRALTAHWDDERTTLANLSDYDAGMTEGERLGRVEGALMKRVYVYLESQGPTLEQRHQDALLGGRAAAATEAELVATGHALLRIATSMGDHYATQAVLDVAAWLCGLLGAPGSGYPVRLPMTHEEDMAAIGQTLAFENGALREQVQHLQVELAARVPWIQPVRLPLADGEGPEDVWIPPTTDCMEYRPNMRCPHCNGERYHHRTRRCGDCGRRPAAAA